jgi:cell division cycle 20-like protein 1 (cofactor of APC complex)
MNSRTTFSLTNLDNIPNSAQQNDRFIPSRSNFDELERELRSPASNLHQNSLEEENNENKIYCRTLKNNLIRKKNTTKTFNDLSTIEENSRFKMPKKFKNNNFRKVAKTPFKVLDAPFLQDDYYLNVVDWSKDNNLAVGLGNTVYMWNFDTNDVAKVTQLDHYNLVSSVTWDRTDNQLVLGAMDGTVQYWDAVKGKKIGECCDHYERVGSISLMSKQLITGSRDKTILLYDLRDKFSPKSVYQSHKQEVCGLKWSPNGEYFASGGNDNKLYVYSPKTNLPLMKKTHKAAVKAIAWSEKQYGLIATGAGSADRCLRLFNVHSQKLIDFKDTGSQICNLLFSKHKNEIITTHGFSNNEVNIWDMNGLKKVASLTGHTSRVLYLSMSPCGGYIVSGAGDETLRFWDLCYEEKSKFKNSINKMNLLNPEVLR